jgi:serine/threonine protein kinase/Ran GTPase-activating protein (RanGAP) involved in mRNA processing and transport
MALELALSLIHVGVFLARAIGTVAHVVTEARQAYREEVQPMLAVLKEYSAVYGAVAKVVGRMEDGAERLVFVNREECQVMAERVAIIRETVLTLQKKYRTAGSESSSSLPKDLEGYVKDLNKSLEKITELICDNILPPHLSFFSRNKWLIQHALKRDEVRAQFAKQSAKLDAALNRLGVGAVIAGLPSVDACSGALTRSDLLEFQQQYADEIRHDMEQQSAEERAALEEDQARLMQKLDEAAILHEKLLHLAQEQLDQGAETQSKVEAVYSMVQKQVTIDDMYSIVQRHANSINRHVDERVAAAIQSAIKEAAIAAATAAAGINNSGSSAPTSPTSSSVVMRARLKNAFSEIPLSSLHVDWNRPRANRLGSGAAGAVWKCVLASGGASSSSDGPVVGTTVAFKVLQFPDRMSDERMKGLLRQLRREAHLMWTLNGHANTVQLLGAVLDEDAVEQERVGLVFEYCNGSTLNERLWESDPDTNSFFQVEGAAAFTPSEKVHAAYQLIQAVTFAHNKSVVHRDIKSANVLLHQLESSRRGSVSERVLTRPSTIVKLSDFGSARAVAHISGMSSLASAGSVRVGSTGGTYRWAPPELEEAAFHGLPFEEQRARETNLAVDVYSLGCVIGEIMTSQPPYAHVGPAAKEMTVIAAVQNDKQVPFPQIIEGSASSIVIPSSIARLIRACTARDPTKRPTMMEIQFHFWPHVVLQMLQVQTIERQPATSAPEGQPVKALDAPSDDTIAASSSPPFTIDVSTSSSSSSTITVQIDPSSSPLTLPEDIEPCDVRSPGYEGCAKKFTGVPTELLARGNGCWEGFVGVHITPTTEPIGVATPCFTQMKMLTTLRIEDSTFTQAELEQLLEAIEYSGAGFQRLELIRCGITDEMMKPLSAFVKASTTLRTLDLRGNLFTCPGAIALGAALRKHPSLEDLDLSATPLQCGGVTALASALLTCTSARNIILAGVGLNDGSAIALASIVRSSLTLRVLDLRDNDGIHAAGILALTDAVDANSSSALHELLYTPSSEALASDPDMATHGQALSSAVAAAKRKRRAAEAAAAGKKEFLGCPTHFVKLEKSKLEELTGIRFVAATLKTSITQLVTALGQMTKLQKLNLQVHQIEQREMEQIAKAIIESGASLRVIDLHKCRIMGAGFDAVCELVKLHSVVTVRLADTTLCANGSMQLAGVIENHPSLELLDCTDNTTLGSEGAAFLSTALQTCSQIHSVSLENCGVGDEGAEALAELVKTSSTLTSLQLSRNVIGAPGLTALTNALTANDKSVISEIDCSNKWSRFNKAELAALKSAVKASKKRRGTQEKCVVM